MYFFKAYSLFNHFAWHISVDGKLLKTAGKKYNILRGKNAFQNKAWKWETLAATLKGTTMINTTTAF